MCDAWHLGHRECAHNPRIVASAESKTGFADFVTAFEREWATSDPDRLLTLLTEDVVLIQPLAPATRGHAAARRSMERWFAIVPDLHVVIHAWGANGSKGFIEFSLVGTLGGREIRWDAVDRFVMADDGRARERISYFDGFAVLLDMLSRPRGWPRIARSRLVPRPFASRARPR